MTRNEAQSIRRRDLLTGAAALGVLGVSAPPLALAAHPAPPPAQGLGAIAASKGILFGASLAVHELDRDHGERYQELYIRDAHILTSELEFKLSTLRPKHDVLDFYGADRLIGFAAGHAMSVRAHTLIWDDDVPDWIHRLAPAGISALLYMHIETIMRRYAGRIRYWDVVNEPIGPWDSKPGNLRAGPFYRALGEDYIARAFRAARAVAPSDILVLNEAQCETADENGETFRTSLLALLRRLKDQGVPIDAIGFQSHLKLAAKYDLPAFTAFLHEVADLGFDIHITELDVNDSTFPGDIAVRDRAVARMYRAYLDAVLKVTAVKVVETWQLSDATSWMNDPATQARMAIRSNPRPLPYDASFLRKPAWDAIAEAFDAAPARCPPSSSR